MTDSMQSTRERQHVPTDNDGIVEKMCERSWGMASLIAIATEVKDETEQTAMLDAIRLYHAETDEILTGIHRAVFDEPRFRSRPMPFPSTAARC